MDVEQLIGRYLRLKHELTIVLKSIPFQRDRAERLARDLASTHVEMRRVSSVDEQTDDALGFATSAFLAPASEFGDGVGGGRTGRT